MTPDGLPVPSAGAADVAVAVASGGATWELDLIPLVERHRSGLHLVRRCVDLADLLAVSRTGLVEVAVVSAGLVRLDRDEVARLRACGVAVLLVEDETTAGSSLALGVADVVHADAGGRHLLGRVQSLGRRTTTAPSPQATQPAAPVGRLGHLVAVWGAQGAPGRSTVALNLAVESARQGTSTLLVDADAAGGAISTMLGVLDEAPGLAAACRSAARERLDVGVLAAHAVMLEPDLRVLTGATRPDRWRELRPAALGAVWDAARTLAEIVVVDLPAGLGSAGSTPFEVAVTTPGEVAAAVLEMADVVVVVGSADPVGMLRLVHALDQLDEAGIQARRLVVVNRVRESVVGAHPQRQVREALDRFAGGSAVHLLPDDPRATDRALRAGVALADVAPAGDLRAGIVGLLAAARPEPVTTPVARVDRRRRPRRHRHRRFVPSVS